MRIDLIRIIFLVLPIISVNTFPAESHKDANIEQVYDDKTQNIAPYNNTSESRDEQVISVRITSSVAVGRGKIKGNPKTSKQHYKTIESPLSTTIKETLTSTTMPPTTIESDRTTLESLPELAGANIEFIKQLNAKKEARGLHNLEQVHPFQYSVKNQQPSESDSIAEASLQSELKLEDRVDENIENVPLARSVSQIASQKNYIRDPNLKPTYDEDIGTKLTTVSFNILHDAPNIDNYNQPSDSYNPPSLPLGEPETIYSEPEKNYSEPAKNYNEPAKIYNEPEKIYSEPAKIYNEPAKIYSEPEKIYSEPAKIYSQPAQIYSEPAKFYSEPSKIYSEPAKIYSEPAKVYSEPAKIYSDPAKIYSEPAKFYSQPASLNLPPQIPPSPGWQQQSPVPSITTTIEDTTPITTLTDYTISTTISPVTETEPEKNYEVDEKVSVQTDGRSHGVQESSTEKCKDESCKVGYVVEGRQYRKYRVEERTPDGFIVGEYGVVRNEDGALRGVRYTADSDASPRLIYDALMKFLQLK